jgi:hypothetical protein
MMLLPVSRRLLVSLLTLGCLLPFVAAADHDCIETRDTGHQIDRRAHLPRKWLMLNGRHVSSGGLLADLRSVYRHAYRGNPHGLGGLICIYTGDIYVNVAKYDSGSWFEFSVLAPTCWQCAPVPADSKLPTPDSGLRIGQTKAQVSKILGISFPDESDLVTVTFSEVETRQRAKRWHQELLTVEFRDDKLVRFHVGDFREDT